MAGALAFALVGFCGACVVVGPVGSVTAGTVVDLVATVELIVGIALCPTGCVVTVVTGAFTTISRAGATVVVVVVVVVVVGINVHMA